MPLSSDITAILLAGGEGRRLKYRNKGLVDYQGQPLAEHVLTKIRPQVDQTVIVANADLDKYRALNPAVIEDANFKGQGPLAGLLAGAHYATTAWLLVVPCDLPDLPTDLAARLAAGLNNAAVAIAHDGQRAQFLVALLRKDAALRIEDYLLTGQRSVHGWLATQELCTVDFSDQPNSFRNLNSPQDLC